MNCSQADIWLVEYLYGELPEQERQAFELHLQSCSAHAKEVERLRAVLSLMRKDSREDPSDRVSKEIVRAAEASMHRTSRPWGWLGWIRTPIAAAAALLVVIGIGAVVYFNEGFEKRSLESASKVGTMEPSSPQSLAGSDAKAPVVADTGSLGSNDERKIVLENTEPALGTKSAPQKTMEGWKGRGEESKLEARRPQAAPPAATAAPARTVQRKVLAEDKKASLSAPAEAVADKTMGAASNEELPPLSDSDADLSIRRYMGEFATCARNHASIKGKMVLEVTIANNGVVTNVSVPEKFKGTAYADCIVSWVKKILFPKFEGPPKTVSFPLVTR